MSKQRAIFLDRDGVINLTIIKDGKPYPPKNRESMMIADEVLPALHRLKHAGFLLIVVTNQPDVARGTTEKTIIEDMHDFLRKQLPLDDILVCYHDDSDNCSCRKPKPGLLLQATENYNIDLRQSYMIGDRWRDIDAGQAAGCISIFLKYGYIEKQPDNPDHTASSLTQATDWIINNENEVKKT